MVLSKKKTENFPFGKFMFWVKMFFNIHKITMIWFIAC